MTLLDLVLGVKIAATGLFGALPLLAFPRDRVMQLLDVNENAVAYLRLYGVSILALLVGYASGFSFIVGAALPTGILCMGIVSNGFACAALLMTGAYRANRLMTVTVGAIAAALSLCLARPELAMTTL